MNSRLLPAEHVFSLFLNLAVISISAFSLAKLLPQSIQLHAKESLMEKQLQLAKQQVQQLEDSNNQVRSQPQINAKKFANLSQQNNVIIFWQTEEEQ